MKIVIISMANILLRFLCTLAESIEFMEDPLEKGSMQPTQYPFWRIPVDREVWWTIDHGAERVDLTE